MKYSNHLSLIVLLALTIFTSCNSDDKTSDVLSEIKDIKDLPEDPVFSSYLNLIFPGESIPATDFNAATIIMRENSNLAAINNTQKLNLANHLGFIDYDDMIEYTNSVNKIRKQLEEMYKLSSYDWNILQPIYKKEISEMISSNRSKRKKRDPKYNRCQEEDRDINSSSYDDLSWLCEETLLDNYLECLEDHRIIAQTDSECESGFFLPTVVPQGSCSATSESYLSFRRKFAQRALEYECCVIQSCESVDLYQEDYDEYCPPLLIG